ncbi:MAG: hypothetical protein CMJ58_26950 [Planctomycetaceae bacterium]|nr:hypothetical protein [Planctomycetaceae bacterium]
MRSEAPDILLIEDSDLDYEMCVRAIREVVPNASIRRATECSDARKELKTSSPSLMILDINLQTCNGLDFLERMASLRNSLGSIVVFSTSTDPRDRDRARNAGAADFFEKPFRPQEYLSTVQTIVSRYVCTPPC